MTKAKKYQLNRGAQMKCPHCGSNTTIRTSREIDTLSRDVYYDCRNAIDCGHQFVGQLTIKHSIVASQTPRAGLVLAVRPPVSPPKPANDDTVPAKRGVPANDTDASEQEIVTTPG